MIDSYTNSHHPHNAYVATNTARTPSGHMK